MENAKVCSQNLPNSETCVSCFTCQVSCNNNAISSKFDEEGFYFPFVDTLKCTSCGKCIRSCPVLNYDKLEKNSLDNCKSYASWNLNAKIQYESTSGGIFSSFCESIINKGGVVYGASFDHNWNVNHERIAKTEDLSRLRGSKYVQSNMYNIGKSVLQDLAAGRKVLFSGTPCQIAGIKSLTSHCNDSRLLLVELICHGVPSPLLFSNYLDYLIKKENIGEIKSIQFRSKIQSWTKPTFSITFEKQKYEIDYDQNPYIVGFSWCWTLRKSCFNCKFSNPNRSGDIILGDLWHDRSNPPDYINPMGTSALIILTPKGNDLFNSIKDNIFFESVNLNDIAKHNPRLLTGRYNDLEYLLKKRQIVFNNLNNPEIVFSKLLVLPNLTVRVIRKFNYMIRFFLRKLSISK